MYRLEFITSLLLPSKKKEQKLKSNGQFDYAAAWLEGATGTSSRGCVKPRWPQALTTRHNSPPFWSRAAVPGSHTVTHAGSCVEASGGEHELFLQEIPALLHVTVIARKQLSLSVYQKQLLNISAFHPYLIKNHVHLRFSKSICFLWCLTGRRDAEENTLSPSQAVWYIKDLHYHLELGNRRL